MSAEGGQACRISIEDFEGPLDLLLFLIRRDELDITTVNAAMVADQYLDYIRQAVELDLDIAGEYLVMAATLTRMKSRSLLPVERAIMEETEDPMESLMRHIVLYRAFKEAAEELRESESLWRDVFSFPGERERYEESVGPPDPGQTSLLDLLMAIENLTEKNTPPPSHRIPRPLLSLTECVESLDRLLGQGGCHLFREAVGSSAEAARIVSLFVAVLELMKRGWLVAQQNYPMGDISLQRTERWAENA